MSTTTKVELKSPSKYDRFAKTFGIIQLIISIGLIGLALLFEFRKQGDIDQSKQATFSHLFLAYACYMFLTAALLLTVVVTYKLFTFYIVLNSILSALNLAIAIMLYVSSKKILSHGTAVQIHDMTSFGLAIIFLLFAILLAVMSIVTGIKLAQLNRARKRESDQQRFQLEVLAAADANDKLAKEQKEEKGHDKDKEKDVVINIPKEITVEKAYD